MRHRWRTLVRPEAIEHHTSPDPGEAFGVWMLGVLWALACLWLGYLGSPWVLPGALLAGLLALWGWRHFEWLWWFPAVLVVATMLEPLSPLPMRSRFGPLVYIDLLTLGVVLVAWRGGRWTSTSALVLRIITSRIRSRSRSRLAGRRGLPLIM